MRTAQAERKVEIIRSMALSTDEYTLEMALADVTQYFYDGTLTRSFERLAAEAKQKQQEAEAEVLKAKKGEE